MNGIWIRSQDRKKLLIVNEIRIMHHDITIFCGSEIVGTYSTEEKAIKVLDKIAKFIEKVSITSVNSDNDTYPVFVQVFKMPPDSEVK